MRALRTILHLRRVLLMLVLLPLVVASSSAYPGGIVGRTLAPSCGACHGPAGAATTVAMSSANGSFTTSPGGTIAITMTVAHTSKVAAGVNVAVHDIGGANAGTLSVDNNSGLRVSLGEVTHSAPKLMSNGSATFTFAWTAPTTPGSYYLRGSGNAVDNTGGSDNDQFNYLQNGPIYLNITGQVGTPSALQPTSGTLSVPTTASLSWAAVSGAIAFEYELSTTSGFTVIATGGTVYSTSSVVVPNLRTGTAYYWRVRSLSVLSTSAYVSSSFTTVSGPPTSLAIPAIITPLSGATSVATIATLIWSTIPEAQQYDYQISTRSNYSVLTASGTISLTTATIGGLQYNTLYYWRVRSRYGTVLSGYRSATFTTVAGQPPTVVAPIAHTINVPSTSAVISWSAISDAAGYNYQVSTESTFSALLLNVNTASTSATLPVLRKDFQYYWRVRAYGTAMGTTPFATANFVTEVPKVARRLVVVNAPDFSPKSFVPFTVMIRTATAAGGEANVTRATTLAFAENSPMLSVVGSTSVVLDMGQHVTTLSLVLHNATASNITADLTAATASSVVVLASTTQSITVQPLAELSRVVHIAPVSNASAIPTTTPTALVWKTVEGATAYTLQVSTSADFSSLVNTVLLDVADPFATTATTAVQFSEPVQYWWRVQAANIITSASWSVAWNFTAGRFFAPIDVTVLLEGAYMASGTMATLLNRAGYVPSVDPYTGAVLAASVPATAVDWVQLEFRPVSAISDPGQTQSLFVRSDGKITAVDGSTTDVVDISRILPGDYRLVVRHRNHLPVMSATTLTLSADVVQPLDLSVSANAYSEFGAALKEVETGRYAMIAGDVHADGSIGAADRVAVRNASGQTGYNAADVSLDGIVGAADRVMVMNNRFAVSQVP